MTAEDLFEEYVRKYKVRPSLPFELMDIDCQEPWEMAARAISAFGGTDWKASMRSIKPGTTLDD